MPKTLLPPLKLSDIVPEETRSAAQQPPKNNAEKEYQDLARHHDPAVFDTVAEEARKACASPLGSLWNAASGKALPDCVNKEIRDRTSPKKIYR